MKTNGGHTCTGTAELSPPRWDSFLSRGSFYVSHAPGYAQYALGKLYLLGRQAPPDHEAAVRWLEQSAAQGNEAARATLKWMKHLRSPSVLSAATRLLHHMSRIFQEQSTSGSIASIRFTDSKLRQRIREKKIAMGHKPDDHEDQEIRMS